MFKEQPVCEVCKKKEATVFSAAPNSPSNDWKFECDDHESMANYYIPIDKYFANPCATVDWNGHMNEKSWINWDNFMDMMSRFRANTNCYNS